MKAANQKSNFPVIRELSDVLPAIEDRTNFVVSERPKYTVVCYRIMTPNSFDETPSGRIRKECRGLIFDKDEKLISRPFHKFFNVNENDDSLAHKIDMSRPHVLQEKVDGSMVQTVHARRTNWCTSALKWAIQRRCETS